MVEGDEGLKKQLGWVRWGGGQRAWDGRHGATWEAAKRRSMALPGLEPPPLRLPSPVISLPAPGPPSPPQVREMYAFSTALTLHGVQVELKPAGATAFITQAGFCMLFCTS